MIQKTFQSRLFRKKINSDDPEYWELLLAEILFRLQEIDQLKCPCTACISEKAYLQNLIQKMVNELHIHRFRQPNFAGVGDCGRTSEPLPPRA